MKNWGKFRRSMLKVRTPAPTCRHNDRGGRTFKGLRGKFDFGAAITYEDG
jgi:hypothetical protein